MPQIRSRSSAKRSMLVGRDVHKESIDVSLAEEGRDGEVRPQCDTSFVEAVEAGALDVDHVQPGGKDREAQPPVALFALVLTLGVEQSDRDLAVPGL